MILSCEYIQTETAVPTPLSVYIKLGILHIIAYTSMALEVDGSLVVLEIVLHTYLVKTAFLEQKVYQITNKLYVFRKVNHG